MTGVDLDALDAARVEEGETLPWRLDPHDAHHVQDRHGNGVTNTFLADDAALIVAAVNALPELIAAVRERDALRAALADLFEAVGRGDEVGLPEAHRAAHKILADVDGAPS